MAGEDKFSIEGIGGKIPWISNAGDVKGTELLTKYNFNLMPHYGSMDWAAASGGSLLVSNPFRVNARQQLIVQVGLYAAKILGYNDVGFGLLLKNGALDKVLFAMRPDGIYHIND